MKRHRETPLKRINPSGKIVWVARYTRPDGRRVSAGTFKLQRDAQDAIDAAYDRPLNPDRLGAYVKGWTGRHPRSERTNRTNEHRIGRVLDVMIEGRTLSDWPLPELRRRHALELVDHLLREQQRSPSGAINIIRALSAMVEDAITDDCCDINPFKGVRVRASDPRATKQDRRPRVWTFEQMHAFAAKAGIYEPMVRTLADCGLRVGELLALRREHLDLASYELRLAGSAWNGRVQASSREKHHDRIVPVPPTLVAMLTEMPKRIDTPWLFPTLRGKLWRYDNWRRDVWVPTVRAAGMNPTPQEFRHSWNSHLRAAGIDPADLAEIAGHSVETATARYTHPLRRSFEQVRGAVG